MDKFIINKDVLTNVKKFNLKGRRVEFNITPVPYNEDPLSWFKSAVDGIIVFSTKDINPEDQIGFSFCSKDFKERHPGWLAFRKAADVKLDDVWGILNNIFQSNSHGMNTDTFCLSVTTVKMPIGKGNERRHTYNSFDEECRMRKGIIVIQNKDNLCLPRAIIVAKAYVEKDKEYKKIRRNIGKLQTVKVMELLEQSGIDIPPEGAGIHELRKFQSYLKEYKITVYKYGSNGRDIYFEGDPESIKYKINILFHNGHFNVINSLTAAFCCGYYCDACHIPYNNKNEHRCGGTCPCCQSAPACEKKNTNITCADCNRNFRGAQCYEKHKLIVPPNDKNTCSQINRCGECLKTVKSDRIHVCDEIFCNICNEHKPNGHNCYIQPDRRKPDYKNTLFIFFDLETRQEKMVENAPTNKIHEPNLCVFRQYCDNCIETPNITICDKCGVKQHVLKINPVERFMEFVLNQRKLFKKVVCIAHNGQAFDYQFILNYILYKTDKKPELILRGTKILMMQVQNVKFIDSLNYFPMKLSLLPKTFDLPSTFKKGYFPHLFNTSDNENYIGSLPDKSYYAPHEMKGTENDEDDDRKMFLKWYEEHKTDTFDMQKEIVEYCVSDVQILSEACLKFRALFLKECNVDPFIEAVTIASACNLVYRRNFLKANTIGIIPRLGYRWCDNQSVIAIQWLLFEEKQRNISILCAARQKEAVLNGVKVDGYCPSTNEVFEFHGCYFHGHTCIKFKRDKPLYDNPTDTLNLRYETTLAKTERLKKLGYKVIEMWECEFREVLNKNKDLEYLKTHPLLNNAPLIPRDAFYGGRTGNASMHYKAKEGEKIKYIDVCSLYPWVCKYGKFPVGHPKVVVGNYDGQNLNLEQTDGLIKCTILPPQNLYHPILPLKQNNKLMFSLCRTCSENLNQSDCMHSDNERAITGTWVIDEVVKALQNNYKILEIHEIWVYETEQYDRHKKEGGLFTQMMDQFIKMKQSASGFPAHCSDVDEKQEYIENFLNSEGIQLQFAEIIKQPGRRSLAKLILNSFWGKFGQRENQPKTSIMNQPNELFEMLSNPSISVNHILPINEETIIVNWEYIEEACNSLATVNVSIAAYTTTQARLKLYEYLQKLNKRVLYYDTDSVIYVSRDGEYEPPTGTCTGDMTDELEEYGVGSYITEFVSGGPKNYAYKVWSTTNNKELTVCKVKGIRLNYEASKIINFEKIKDMVLTERQEPVYIISRNIRRTAEHEVITTAETKLYRIRSEKRRFLSIDESIPYGYKRTKIIDSSNQ